MIIHYAWNNKKYKSDLAQGIDLSIPYTEKASQVNCFYAPLFESTPVEMGEFIGSVQRGGPVNYFNTRINIHGNGTHTEGVGHLNFERDSVNSILKEFHFVSYVVSVYPTQIETGDKVITRSSLEILLDQIQPECLILRTLPNRLEKRTFHYSGSNPCYIEKEAMGLLIEKGIKHLLVDIPSVDRESDGGQLRAHHAYWVADRAKECTITELIFIPDEIKDGYYMLNLQLAAIESDASPSRPVIYKMYEVETEI